MTQPHRTTPPPSSVTSRTSRTPARNRLARPLTDAIRDALVEAGVPRRKYTAVLDVTLDDGSLVRDVVVEEGWVIAVGRDALVEDVFSTPIGFDVSRIDRVEVRLIV